MKIVSPKIPNINITFFNVDLLGFRYSDALAYNVLRLPDGFYFGLSWHCRFVKNIAIKIKKLLTEIYIAIFYLQEFYASFKVN